MALSFLFDCTYYMRKVCRRHESSPLFMFLLFELCLLYGQENLLGENYPVLNFGSAFTVLPVDEIAARRCSHLKAEREEHGEPLDDLDLQIASVALVYDLPLTTNNTKHFKRVRDLRIENWIRGAN